MRRDFIERVNREMAQDLAGPKAATRELLASACRILAAEGHESGLAGRATARASKPGTGRAARLRLRAMAAGGCREVKRERAEEARDFLLLPSIVRGTFAYWARRCA